MQTVAQTAESRELQLFIENDGELYRQQTQAIQRNLSRKHKKGIYNHALAPKIWKYLADNGAKKYEREYGNGNGFGVFTPAIRRETAQSMANDYLFELEARNYTE